MIVKLRTFLRQNHACSDGTRLAACRRSRQMIDVWDRFVAYRNESSTFDGANVNPRSYHAMRYRRWFAFMLSHDPRVPTATRRALARLAKMMFAADYLVPADEAKLRRLVIKAWASIK